MSPSLLSQCWGPHVSPDKAELSHQSLVYLGQSQPCQLEPCQVEPCTQAGTWLRQEPRSPHKCTYMGGHESSARSLKANTANLGCYTGSLRNPFPAPQLWCNCRQRPLGPAGTPHTSHSIPPHLPPPAAGASGVPMPSAAQGNSSLWGATEEVNSTTGIKFLKQKKNGSPSVLDEECNIAVLAVPWQSRALTGSTSLWSDWGRWNDSDTFSGVLSNTPWPKLSYSQSDFSEWRLLLLFAKY